MNIGHLQHYFCVKSPTKMTTVKSPWRCREERLWLTVSAAALLRRPRHLSGRKEPPRRFAYLVEQLWTFRLKRQNGDEATPALLLTLLILLVSANLINAFLARLGWKRWLSLLCARVCNTCRIEMWCNTFSALERCSNSLKVRTFSKH